MEHRSMMSLLIGVTLCVSIWHIMLQQQQEQYYDASLPSVVLTSSSSLMNDSFYYASTLTSLDSVVATLPKNDLSQLIDLDNFEFLMNPKTCRDLEQQPLVVVLVHSAPDNVQKRQTIRETWGVQNDSRSLLLFLIGNVNGSVLAERVGLENQLYGDLVQGSFNDAYRNMTYKHVMALKWFVYHCPGARYLLKTDDDVFVNSPLLYDVLARPTALFERLHRGRLVYCHKIERAKVKRTFRSKWRVSFDEYRDKFFPSHCPGFIILYSGDVVRPLYFEAQRLPYFWIDDVHITGTVASKLNLSITSFDDAYLSASHQSDLLNARIISGDDDDDEGNDDGGGDDRALTIAATAEALLPLTEVTHSFLFSHPNLGEMEIRRLWKLVRRLTNSTSARHRNANDNEVAGSSDDDSNARV
jgi:hypothetical protein